MKKYLLACPFLFVFSAVSAQKNNVQNAYEILNYDVQNHTPAHVQFQLSEKVQPQHLDTWIINKLNANKDFTLKAIDSNIDIGGNKHIRYRQYYKGIAVDGGTINLHCKGEKPYSFNGVYYPNLELDLSTNISEKEALEIAKKAFPEGSIFGWEEAAIPYLNLNGNIPSDPIFFYPTAEMVIFVRDENGNIQYTQTYQFSVATIKPFLFQKIFVDAKNGNILDTRTLVYNHDKTAIAHTKYSGIQPIVCDSIDTNLYTLTERNRGLDSIFMTNSKAPPHYMFFNKDTIWNNRNPKKDEVAGDVMWGFEKTYDFYKEKFGRNSYDNKGHSLRGVLHDDKDNAYWVTGRANFGDGNDTTYDAWTSIDIVGHEITHGVTQTTSNLLYERESGALNESYSDIFGKCIEYYAIPDSFTWGFTEKICLNGQPPYRSFSDPNSRFHPKYYKGKYYDDTTAKDRYGVHTNSSVQNYWFYLLCEGGTGFREADGKPYTVSPIGIDTAGMIAFYTLTNYLTEKSGFKDAATYSIAAARLLFGDSSHYAKEVFNAWYAVGVLYSLGVENNATSINNQSIKLYPNPSTNTVFVNSTKNLSQTKFQLYDILGKVIQTNFSFINNYEVKIDLQNIPSGLYLLEAEQNGERQVLKLRKD